MRKVVPTQLEVTEASIEMLSVITEQNPNGLQYKD